MSNAIGSSLPGSRQAAAVQLGEERLRVREQLALPGVARPARPVALRNRLDAMPVHVEHRDGERRALGVEAVHQRDVALGAVAVVAAPPVAKRPARQHGLAPGQRVEGAQRLGVVEAEAEQVRVDLALGARANPAVVLEQEGPRVVELGDPQARHDARLERRAAVDVVERAGRAAKVVHRLAIAPHAAVVRDAAAQLHAQARGRERAAVVGQPQPVADDLQRRLAVRDVEVRHGQVAMDREGRRAVLEGAVVRPLEPQQTVGEDRDPPAVALHDCFTVGERRRVEAQVRVQRSPFERRTAGRAAGARRA
jgi:hypothetical protein